MRALVQILEGSPPPFKYNSGGPLAAQCARAAGDCFLALEVILQVIADKEEAGGWEEKRSFKGSKAAGDYQFLGLDPIEEGDLLCKAAAHAATSLQSWRRDAELTRKALRLLTKLSTLRGGGRWEGHPCLKKEGIKGFAGAQCEVRKEKGVKNHEADVGGVIARACTDVLEQFHAPQEDITAILVLLEAAAELQWTRKRAERLHEAVFTACSGQGIQEVSSHTTELLRKSLVILYKLTGAGRLWTGDFDSQGAPVLSSIVGGTFSGVDLKGDKPARRLSPPRLRKLKRSLSITELVDPPMHSSTVPEVSEPCGHVRDDVILHKLRQHDVALRFSPESPLETTLVYDRYNPRIHGGDKEGLRFDSDEAGMNLWRVNRISEWEYDLILQEDLGTRVGVGSTGWFYFAILGALEGAVYKFNFLNVRYQEFSPFNHGVQPLFYSNRIANTHGGGGWQRVGWDMSVHEGYHGTPECPLQTFTFSFEVPEGTEGGNCYLARSYPFGVKDVQRDMQQLATHPSRRRTMRRSIMSRSLSGSGIELLTITNHEVEDAKKMVIAVSCRSRPGDVEASWCLRGFLDFLTAGNNAVASKLRDSYIFKVAPMLCPDGVEAGHTLCDLGGQDISEMYDKPHPKYEAGIHAWKGQLNSFGKKLAMLIDIRTRRGGKGLTMWGSLPEGEGLERQDVLKEACALPYAVAQHSTFYEVEGTRVGVPKDGCSARGMAWHELKLAHAYEYAVGLCGEEKHATQYSQRALEKMGTSLALGLRDWHQALSNPEATQVFVDKVVLWEGYKAAERVAEASKDLVDPGKAGFKILLPGPDERVRAMTYVEGALSATAGLLDSEKKLVMAEQKPQLVGGVENESGVDYGGISRLPPHERGGEGVKEAILQPALRREVPEPLAPYMRHREMKNKLGITDAFSMQLHKAGLDQSLDESLGIKRDDDYTEHAIEAAGMVPPTGRRLTTSHSVIPSRPNTQASFQDQDQSSGGDCASTADLGRGINTPLQEQIRGISTPLEEQTRAPLPLSPYTLDEDADGTQPQSKESEGKPRIHARISSASAIRSDALAGTSEAPATALNVESRDEDLSRSRSEISAEICARASIAAAEVMGLSDRNRNGELSYTELTVMLEGTEHEGFGRWVKTRRQHGWRSVDSDGKGSLDVTELTKALELYLASPASHPESREPLSRLGTRASHHQTKSHLNVTLNRGVGGGSVTAQPGMRAPPAVMAPLGTASQALLNPLSPILYL